MTLHDSMQAGSKTIPVLSLFCGAGGLDWGFRRECFEVILACDSFPAAVDTYNRNSRKKVARVTDLTLITPKKLMRLTREMAPDVAPLGVIGGPPCQGFSRGNVSAAPDDPRNLLPFRYAEILAALNEHHQLSFFVFENVMGLLGAKHSERLASIHREFEAAGFNLFQQQLNANAFGVPQNRPRLFIVGLNAKLFPDIAFSFPKGRSRRKTVRDAIARLPHPAYFLRGMLECDIPHHPNHWTMMPKSPKFKSEKSTDGRSFRQLEWDKESPAVAYGNREIHIHPDGGRRLSVYEAMLLQGFPRSYRLTGTFSQQVTQVSNAVPPPVAKALARRIRNTILKKCDRFGLAPSKRHGGSE